MKQLITTVLLLALCHAASGQALTDPGQAISISPGANKTAQATFYLTVTSEVPAIINVQPAGAGTAYSGIILQRSLTVPTCSGSAGGLVLTVAPGSYTWSAHPAAFMQATIDGGSFSVTGGGCLLVHVFD